MIDPADGGKGYDREFSTTITVASATCSLFRPVANMVIYAMIAGGVSVGKLFLAVYQGILIGLALMISGYYIAYEAQVSPRTTPAAAQIVDYHS